MTAAAIASRNEAEILVAHHWATARPFLKEVRSLTDGETNSSITDGGTNSLTITIPQEKRVPAYLSGSNSSEYSRCPQGEVICLTFFKVYHSL
ncbi:hypothetical protein AVEN_266600-1 [Araneus ventricosus]|uniref:Uncharacterized protein n=1 Tax=Araneus ventricosus TaxID=182803 RepID=A0A4Y2URB1_ARAVE|nr:hypothetical protein AVEN_266600-1 [Araneus ventricosus]